MQISEKSPEETNALLTIALSAALCDGAKSEKERETVRELARELDQPDLGMTTRQLLLGKTNLPLAAAALTDAPSRQLAYEMALAVCEAEGGVRAAERDFLAELRKLLGLGDAECQAADDEVHQVFQPPGLPAQPTPPESSAPDNSAMILKYAILNGALELLPESLATMAILPLQLKMVYRIGRSHGVSLDTGHIKEFLGVLGIGMGSQMLEGFARKLLGGLGRQFGGKMGRTLAGQAAGSAMSFASTYAIGHLAQKYYAGGRQLSTAALRESFGSLQRQAVELHQQYLPAIRERSQNLTPARILDLARGSTQP